MIPFGQYLPDLPPFENPGATVANNVLPAANGYLPMPSGVAQGNALTAYCRGAVMARDKSNNIYVYAGDETTLYSLSDGTFSSVTRSSGGDYATDTRESWEFAAWDQTIIATNFSDDVQDITFGDANFAALGGSPPKARHIGVVRDFVVLGNINDSVDGLVPNRVHWSGIGNSETWAVSATTQADYQDLKGSGGWVQRVVGGEYGVIFQERSITRMTYAGSPVIWQFDEVEPGRGAFAAGSVCQVGSRIFYLSDQGFEVLIDGSQSRPIGHERVDRTFFADLDEEYIHRITCSADVTRRMVWWAYPGAQNVGGEPNKILVYDWANDQWSAGEEATQVLFFAASGGYTLDSLDVIAAAQNSELVTNGSFGSDSNWVKGTGWTIGSGVASHAAGSASSLQQALATTPTENAGYYLSFTVSNRTAGSVTPSVGGTDGTARSTNATFTETITAGADGIIEFAATSDFDGDIDDVSLKSASLDTLTESLDSRAWTGGAAEIAKFNSDNKLAFLSGAAKDATIETVEAQVQAGQRSRVTAFRPMIDGASTVTAQVGTRDLQASSVEYGSELAQSATGRFTTRADGRYHRVRIKVSGGFTHAIGVELESSTPMGTR